MRLLKKISIVFAVLTLLMFSGCGDVFDSINKELLDIDDDETKSSSSSSTTTSSSTSTTGGSSGIDVNIGDGNSSSSSSSTTTTSSGGNSSSTTSSGSTDSDNSSSGDSSSGSTPNDDSNFTFSLSFPEFENKKAIELDLGFKEKQEIEIIVTPQQPDLILELKDSSGDSGTLKKAELLRDGEPNSDSENNYKFYIESEEKAGRESFRLQLESEYFSDFVDIDVNVIKQIKVTSARETYDLLIKGDEQNITIEALNLKGHPLEFSIENIDDINDREVVELTYSGQRVFTKDTDNVVQFMFLAKGIQEGVEKITVKVKDREADYSDYIPITLQSNRANKRLFEDLYECGSNYSNVNLKEYEITVDSNTRDSLGGSQSNDKALTLLSSYNLKYDIGNEFSTVMVFHPRQITYTQSDYGKYYIYLKSDNKQIASVYYGSSLEDREFFVKYYDENTNGVVCESHRFPPMQTISNSLVIQETTDKNDMPQMSQ